MREQKLRDTNESTNERVKWFAFGTMGMLVGLGAWQVVYLRAYFRYVVRDLMGCRECSKMLTGVEQVKASHLKHRLVSFWFSWLLYHQPCFLRTEAFSMDWEMGMKQMVWSMMRTSCMKFFWHAVGPDRPCHPKSSVCCLGRPGSCLAPILDGSGARPLCIPKGV